MSHVECGSILAKYGLSDAAISLSVDGDKALSTTYGPAWHTEAVCVLRDGPQGYGNTPAKSLGGSVPENWWKVAHSMNESLNEKGSSNTYGDEISLIDLTKILVRRWKLMVAIFLVIVLGALMTALLVERTFEYVSIYQVAEQSPRDSQDLGALEAPATVVAKISNLYLGSVARELRSTEKLERLPFDVSISNPNDTLLIRLSSETSEANGALVETMHSNLLQQIKADQQAQIARRRLSLERQLESAQRSLDAAQGSSSPAAAELIAVYSSRVAEMEERLALLQEGQVAQTAVRSLEPVGTSPSLIMALAIVLGALLAVMGAFVIQFVGAVRDSLRKEC